MASRAAHWLLPLLLLPLALGGPAAAPGEVQLQDALEACQADASRLAARVAELEGLLAPLAAPLARGGQEANGTEAVLAELESCPPCPPALPCVEQIDRPWGRKFWKNCICAFFCVALAALAAGLTMGMVSIEPMEMEIIVKTEEKDMMDEFDRQRLKEDQKAAYSVLPLIKDHHRLLVTLLLMNSLANEALPLFLDQIVPSWLAVILSVSLVLLFGEIIPSAIFTGSGQLRIASKFAPLVNFVLVFLAPLAMPIAWVLDSCLGEDHKGRYNFAELRAIVGIHARLNTDDQPAHAIFKCHDDEDRGIITTEQPHGFTSHTVVVFTGAAGCPARSTKLKADGTGYYVKPCLPLSGRDAGCTFRLYMHEAQEEAQLSGPSFRLGDGTPPQAITFKPGELTSGIFKVQERDELKIMHGVMNLTHMTAGEAMKPLSEVWMLENKQRLNETVMKEILACGYSRLPVYDTNKHNVRGFILVKKLIIISPDAEGGKGVPLESIELARLICVPPNIPMLDLLNRFQEERRHMALITNQPNTVLKAWADGKDIPPDVHMAGIITLEDVIEKLLQEDIDDEHDAEGIADRKSSNEYCFGMGYSVKAENGGYNPVIGGRRRGTPGGSRNKEVHFTDPPKPQASASAPEITRERTPWDKESFGARAGTSQLTEPLLNDVP